MKEQKEKKSNLTKKYDMSQKTLKGKTELMVSPGKLEYIYIYKACFFIT